MSLNKTILLTSSDNLGVYSDFRMLLAIIANIVAVFILWQIFFPTIEAKLPTVRNKHITQTIARVAIFGAIATILYAMPMLQFKIPLFPSFLEFHFDEIPVFIAGFAYGPLTSFYILIIKTLIKLPMTSTAGVGELADLLYSSAFIIPAALIYKKNRTMKGAWLGFAIGFICHLIASSLGNMFFMIDFYMFFYNLPETVLLSIGQLANPNITDVHYSMVLYGILPFNIVKDFIVIVVTFLIYKRTEVIICKKL
jgi:riboflavin transporter